MIQANINPKRMLQTVLLIVIDKLLPPYGSLFATHPTLCCKGEAHLIYHGSIHKNALKNNKTKQSHDKMFI